MIQNWTILIFYSIGESSQNSSSLPIRLRQKQINLCRQNRYDEIHRELVLLLFQMPKTAETDTTKTIAPINEGKIAMPAMCGPQEPSRASPSHEPTSPAMMLETQPIALPRPTIKPAIAPIMVPIITTQRTCNIFVTSVM